ncbi:MAG: hypothetical protein ACK4IT_07000 [Thioalkalivibrionaceae bacterium]
MNGHLHMPRQGLEKTTPTDAALGIRIRDCVEHPGRVLPPHKSYGLDGTVSEAGEPVIGLGDGLRGWMGICASCDASTAGAAVQGHDPMGCGMSRQGQPLAGAQGAQAGDSYRARRGILWRYTPAVHLNGLSDSTVGFTYLQSGQGQGAGGAGDNTAAAAHAGICNPGAIAIQAQG